MIIHHHACTHTHTYTYMVDAYLSYYRTYINKHTHIHTHIHTTSSGDINVSETLNHISRIYGPAPANEGGNSNTITTNALESVRLNSWPLRGAQLQHNFGEPPAQKMVVVASPQINEFTLTVVSAIFVVCNE
jgi:hypothetical protein